jgi:hypothetical protein
LPVQRAAAVDVRLFKHPLDQLRVLTGRATFNSRNTRQYMFSRLIKPRLVSMVKQKLMLVSRFDLRIGIKQHTKQRNGRNKMEKLRK